MSEENNMDEIMTEKRHNQRQRTFLGAKIIIDNHSIYNCLIKSRSEDGFGLKLGSTRGIPDNFVLVDGTTGHSHKCRVIWRKSSGLGVVIVDD